MKGKKLKKPASEQMSANNVSVRLPDELLARIDAVAREETRTRANIFRLLLEAGLKARKQ